MNREEKKVIALTSSSHALTHGSLLILPTVLLLLQEEFSIGYLGLGAINNIMVFTYGLGALPGGMIYDRLGPKKLYLFCFLGSAVALLLVSLAPNLVVFTAGLALLGAFSSVYHPLANSLITSKIQEFGKALGIHGAAGNIGLAAAPFIAALIASHWGWRQAFFWFTVPGIALAIWSLFIDMSIPGKQEGRGGPSLPGAQPNPGPRPKGLWVYLSLPLVLLYLINMLLSYCFQGATIFLPTYMAKHTSFQIFSWDSVAMGGMLSGLALFMGVFGQFTGGVLAQKPHLERNVLIIAGISLPFILSMAWAKDASLLFMAIIFFFLNFALQPMTNVLLAQNATLEMRGTAFGIFFFAGFGLGSLASTLGGYIAENFGLPRVFLGLGVGVLFLSLCCYLFLKIKKQPRPA